MVEVEDDNLMDDQVNAEEAVNDDRDQDLQDEDDKSISGNCSSCFGFCFFKQFFSCKIRHFI